MSEVEKIQKIMCSNCTDLCLKDESRYGICTLIVKDLLGKFHIIPKSDDPAKWVERTTVLIRGDLGFTQEKVGLKWRGEAKG